MFNNSIQYVNVIKTQQNIKIDYHIMENNKSVKNEHSTFLLDDNNLSIDTNYKLQTLENSIPKTYICAICENENQIIDSNEITAKENEKSIYFDQHHNITLANSNIEKIKQFYNDGSIDYLVSPFSLLDSTIKKDLHSNSLNLLILNNNIYVILLDDNKRYITSCIQQLTSFEDIKNSEFYTDDIVEQKLYDEIYNLELNENITSITNNFYKENPDANFIQSVNIYYNIKQLNDEQVTLLKDNLMIDVKYTSISINELLYDMVKKPLINKQNFIKPRPKKSALSLVSWIMIALVTTIVAGGLFYIMQEKDEVIKKEKTIVKKENKKIIKKIEEIQLPNHIDINTYIINSLLDIFEAIDDNSILKEIQLQKNESTIIYNFKHKNSYETILKPRLLKLYQSTENVLTSKNNLTYTAIISNTKPKDKLDNKITKIYPISNKNKFLDENKAKLLLTSFFNKNTKLKFITKSSNKYTSYTYKLSTIVKSPQDFFNAIDNINKKDYSITLSHPIEFAKIQEGLEINFNIKMNQNISNMPKEKLVK